MILALPACRKRAEEVGQPQHDTAEADAAQVEDAGGVMSGDSGVPRARRDASSPAQLDRDAATLDAGTLDASSPIGTADAADPGLGDAGVGCTVGAVSFGKETCSDDQWLSRDTCVDGRWQSTCSDSFVTRWDTAATPNDEPRIVLPLVAQGEYDFWVAWGDGSLDHITAWDDPARTHRYERHGQYRVQIEGTMVGWQFGNCTDAQEPCAPDSCAHPEDPDNALRLVAIEHFGPLSLGPTRCQFSNAAELSLHADDAPELGQTPSLRGAFYGATLSGSVAAWDVTNVTDMAHMFHAAQFDELGLAGWETSSVTNMSHMFTLTSDFSDSLSTWDTSSVTDMSYMFAATSFNQDISPWNTSNVSNMTHMFADTSTFNRDLSAWDTASVTDMSRMFQYALAFNQDISGWDTSSVADMSGMFARSAFNQDLTSWDTSSVTSMWEMFFEDYVFDGDISAWDTSRVTNTSSMFFRARAFNHDISAWNTSSVTDMSGMFSNASEFDQDISGWDTSNVINMRGLFSDATSFNRDLSGWDTGAVTDMSYMFSGASAFNQDISSWNTSSVLYMAQVFAGASAFDQSLGAWSIENVTQVDGMLSSTALSTANYDSTLVGWAAQSVQTGLYFWCDAQYSSAGETARAVLLQEHGWHIEDGGLANAP